MATTRYKRDKYMNIQYDFYGRPVKELVPTTPRRRRKAPTKAPQSITGVINKIKADKNLNVAIEAMKERADVDTATLVGIALHDPAREYLDNSLDRIWADTKLPTRAGEVIIGAGFHAAVYCSVRAALGLPKPLVLEASDRVGGIFAITRSPSFYLNSRNRPGNLGIPGRGEALNVLPAGPIQPAMLSASEYQRNSDLAFAIRVALAKHAKVVTGFKVANRSGSTLPGKTMRLLSVDGQAVTAKRIIDATGIGRPNPPIRDSGTILRHERVLSYIEFMRRMDDPFPLQGLGRVAVVGAGDSGKTVIEALIGQNPQAGMSVAGLDYPEQIDWFGVPETCLTRASWVDGNRARYKSIGSAFPTGRRGVGDGRVQPLSLRAEEVVGTYEAAMVNGRMYDHVIWCVGFDTNRTRFDDARFERKMVDGRAVAVVGRDPGNEEVYAVGPASELPIEGYEATVVPSAIPENSVALYRYADRTAALARALPGV